MNLDSEHILFWMDAIRNSPDKHRTLESFWKGQVRSKIWLIENMKPFINEKVTIDIHGGWNGVLASLIFQSDINCSFIRSVDIDESCEETAVLMNKLEHMEGRFEAVTADMCSINIDADVVINTSCEHITQEEYDSWIENIPSSSLIILQSNNYDILEHVRIAKNLDEFATQSRLGKILYSNELETSLYKRFMIIGKKNV